MLRSPRILSREEVEFRGAVEYMKETGIRPGEAWRLKWTDVDFEQNMIYVRPEKGSKARVFRISPKLEAMLKALPRKNDYVFNNGDLEHFACNFRKQRRRVAAKLKNLRINMITFKTLRHWKATMEYHRTKDILHVMEVLGHKRIQNTLKYTQPASISWAISSGVLATLHTYSSESNFTRWVYLRRGLRG